MYTRGRRLCSAITPSTSHSLFFLCATNLTSISVFTFFFPLCFFLFFFLFFFFSFRILYLSLSLAVACLATNDNPLPFPLFFGTALYVFFLLFLEPFKQLIDENSCLFVHLFNVRIKILCLFCVGTRCPPPPLFFFSFSSQAKLFFLPN